MKKTGFTLCIAFATCFALTLPETANAAAVKRVQMSKTGVVDQTIRIGAFMRVDGDCNAMEIPLVRVFGDPKHGSVKISQEAIPGYGFKGAYEHCIGKQIQGTAVYYTPEPGFMGQDQVTLRVSSTEGVVKDDVITVDVVK